VLSSTTKKGEIVRKMDPDHLAKGILVFDDQHNMWTNMFASVYSSRCKEDWTKELRMQHLKRRHKKKRRSPRLKKKRSPRNQQSNPWRGQSASALVVHRIVNSTCPVRNGLSGGAPRQFAQRGP
jgi:hypothetical protein